MSIRDIDLKNNRAQFGRGTGSFSLPTGVQAPPDTERPFVEADRDMRERESRLEATPSGRSFCERVRAI